MRFCNTMAGSLYISLPGSCIRAMGRIRVLERIITGTVIIIMICVSVLQVL
jgi:hypothetical protein